VRPPPDITLQGPLQARIGMPCTEVARDVRITLRGVETLLILLESVGSRTAGRAAAPARRPALA
jgi:hypothetical protein